MKKMTMLIVIPLILLLLSGCGGGGDSAGPSNSPQTGSYLFSIQLPQETSQADGDALVMRSIDCATTSIDTITVSFYDVNKTYLYGRTLTCQDLSQSSLQIDDIPAGSGIILQCDITDRSGAILYRGQTAGIDIRAGVVTQGETMSVQAVGSDTTPPQVSLSDPLDESRGVAVTTSISVTFSEAIDAMSIDTTSITLKDASATITGTMTLKDKTLTFTPNTILNYYKTYWVTVAASLKDLAGNQMPQNYTFSFITAAQPDSIRPKVESTTPQDQESNVKVYSAVSVKFDEIMEPLSIDSSTFYVSDDTGAHIQGDITYLSRTATFVPKVNLLYNKTYDVFLSKNVTDLYGNALESGLSWSFTVETIEKTSTNPLGMQLVLIPAGSFTMGSPSDEDLRNPDEVQHTVYIKKSFYIQATEVTQAQWTAVMGSNPSHYSDCGDTCPVDSVSWEDAAAFIETINRMGIGNYRLPTEAEWEYACRATTMTAFTFGQCLSTDQANFDGAHPLPGCDIGQTRDTPLAVGHFSANLFGIFDMHGNSYEWCQDWYGDYTTSEATSPNGPSSGAYRVLRGGAFDTGAAGCRSAARQYALPDSIDVRYGLRLVKETSLPPIPPT